ncbi:MAG: IclR family transcriptional regulator [Thermoleophilaceae bacterium]
MTATEAYFVTRTMRALELLAFGPVSVRQLAAALQIHERTARRMLGRLVDEEYVTRLDEPRRRYVLTLRVAALASQAVKRSELARVAAPVVALLHTQTALTAHLVSPSYDCVLCLVHGAEDGTSTPRLGELVPAHCTAGGKALLAGRDRWRESLLSSPLRAYTDRTITDPGAVEREAATTRERGYAIEDGEYRPGVRALAAPVHDGARATIAAIGVSTSGNVDVEAVSDDVTRAAATLSSARAMPADTAARLRSG